MAGASARCKEYQVRTSFAIGGHGHHAVMCLVSMSLLPWIELVLRESVSDDKKPSMLMLAARAGHNDIHKEHLG